MSPTANGVGRSKSAAMPQPRVGITVYWSATPGRTRARCRPTARKSSHPMVMPMLSMMTPSPIGISGPLNHVKSLGSTNARPLASNTQRGKALVSIASRFNVRELYMEAT